jgi:DNA-binding transcriptional ArsR family regulator
MLDSTQDQLAQELGLLHDRICRAIGDPKRLIILYALSEKPRYVVELAEQLGYPQPTVSRHLNELHRGGLVLKERQGQTVYYSLRDARIIEALEIMRAILRDMTEETARVASFGSPLIPPSAPNDVDSAGS